MEGQMKLFAVKLMMVLIVMVVLVSMGSSRGPPDCCPSIPECCGLKFAPKVPKP